MRKTSDEYQRELDQTRAKLESIESHIKARLMTLIEKTPDAIIKESGEDKFKAKCVNKSYIDQLSPDTIISYIRAIEKHNANLEPYVQMSMYE